MTALQHIERAAKLYKDHGDLFNDKLNGPFKDIAEALAWAAWRIQAEVDEDSE